MFPYIEIGMQMVVMQKYFPVSDTCHIEFNNYTTWSKASHFTIVIYLHWGLKFWEQNTFNSNFIVRPGPGIIHTIAIEMIFMFFNQVWHSLSLLTYRS